MDQAAYQVMAEQERDHWWYRARREFIAAAIRRAGPPAGARLLDAGCGTGGNLPVLGAFGSVYGFEFDAGARALAAASGTGEVAAGALPGPIPFGTTSFDVIGLFDVLEHIAEPVPALEALAQRLAPGGALILTVPACPWLWGPHDTYHHHFRRYTRPRLAQELRAAGLRAEYMSHINTLLLPLAIVQRMKERFVGYDHAALPGRSTNALLHRAWLLERAWIPRWSAPFGLSILAIVRATSDRAGSRA